MTLEERQALSDEALIELLRHQVATWFSNPNLLLFEEMLRRYHNTKKKHDPRSGPCPCCGFKITTVQREPPFIFDEDGK